MKWESTILTSIICFTIMVCVGLMSECATKTGNAPEAKRKEALG